MPTSFISDILPRVPREHLSLRDIDDWSPLRYAVANTDKRARTTTIPLLILHGAPVLERDFPEPYGHQRRRGFDAASRQPLTLERTFISYYDFDQGTQDRGGATECIMFDERHTLRVDTAPATQIVRHAGGSDLTINGVEYSSDWAASGAGSWAAGSALYCASQYGVGRDNPILPSLLSDAERSKALDRDSRGAAKKRQRLLRACVRACVRA